MSNRRAANANRIRGPQSALTDFLASHNISAQQIQQDYQQRLQEAQERESTEQDENKENEEDDDGEDPAERKKRKRKEDMALMKIKQSKEFKRRKFEASKRKEAYGEDEEDDADDTIARTMLAKAKPLPGQLMNCEICEKRFTVTPYSKTGPDGGLLCTKCSKELKDEEKKNKTQEKKKRTAPKLRKRQTESDRMMGEVKPGSKTLAEICVRRVADVVHDIEDFGDMPQDLLDRLSQILSKRRILTPRTLNLFLRPDIDRIDIYDSGRLESEDFTKIFAFMPDLEHVNLRFAGQMKDDSVRYMIEKAHKIRHLQLGATNLVSDKVWVELFEKRGEQLESLKISELNDSLNDDSLARMVKHCQNLRRLKLRSCSHITSAGLESLGKLAKLEHLTLSIANDAPAEVLVDLINSLGHNLRTLSLEDYVEADDTVLSAILNNCTKLTKLRFTGNSNCSDQAFADLFGNNCGNPPMRVIDLCENRDMDYSNPDGGQDSSTGFSSKGLKALLKHSGKTLQRLDLHSNRHISLASLLDAFNGKKKYPQLKDIDLSFVPSVNDVVMNGIFKSCPALTKLAVFACFNARSAKIPAGIAVVGLPNAQDNIIQEGDVDVDMF